MAEHAWKPGEAVSLIAGEGGRAVELGCHVADVQGDVLILRADVVPLQPALLQSESRAWLMSGDGRHVPADLLAVQPCQPPVLRVRVIPERAGPANRREFYRASMHRERVQAFLLNGGHAALCWVRLVDLSGSGARLLCPRPVRAGDSLYLRLPLLGGAPRELSAVAVWCRPTRAGWQTGVRFLHLSERDRDLIVRAVFQQEMRSRRR